MPISVTDYKLSPGELGGIRAWIKFLGIFGSGMPVATDAANKFFAEIIAVSDNYSAITNPSYQWIITSLFSALNGVTNNKEVSLAAQYTNYCNTYEISLAPNDAEYESVAIAAPFTFTSYWVTFLNGYGYRWGLRDDPGLYNVTIYPRGINVPRVFTTRYDAINQLVDSWRPTPSATYIDAQTGAGSQSNRRPAAAAKKVVDDWATANSMPSAVVTVMEANQRLKMKDLMKATDILSADVYYFIFYWLIGLCTGTTADRTWALTIVKEPASSPEYDNEIFINQLIYLILMYVANPKGSFKYTTGQRQDMLKDILAVMSTTDEASVLIKASINSSLDMLTSDSSYPMQDMYNPDKGFNTRLSDTLAALEDGRAGIRGKLS